MTRANQLYSIVIICIKKHTIKQNIKCLNQKKPYSF